MLFEGFSRNKYSDEYKNSYLRGTVLTPENKFRGRYLNFNYISGEYETSFKLLPEKEIIAGENYDTDDFERFIRSNSQAMFPTLENDYLYFSRIARPGDQIGIEVIIDTEEIEKIKEKHRNTV